MRSRVTHIVVFWVVVLGGWHLVASVGIWSPYLFPSPLSVVRALLRTASNGQLLDALSHSLFRLVVG